MSHLSETRKDPRAALFHAMEQVTAGMLGVMNSAQHMQPMTHHPDPEAGEIWFVTSRETDLAREVAAQGGAMAHYCLVGKGQDFHACMKGRLEVVEDRAKLEDLWSRVTAAWFPGGKDDPRVCLLRLRLEDAEVWASTGSAAVFGLEILRANLSEEHAPNLGRREMVTFRPAA